MTFNLPLFPVVSPLADDTPSSVAHNVLIYLQFPCFLVSFHPFLSCLPSILYLHLPLNRSALSPSHPLTLLTPSHLLPSCPSTLCFLLIILLFPYLPFLPFLKFSHLTGSLFSLLPPQSSSHIFVFINNHYIRPLSAHLASHISF